MDAFLGWMCLFGCLVATSFWWLEWHERLSWQRKATALQLRIDRILGMESREPGDGAWSDEEEEEARDD